VGRGRGMGGFNRTRSTLFSFSFCFSFSDFAIVSLGFLLSVVFLDILQSPLSYLAPHSDSPRSIVQRRVSVRRSRSPLPFRSLFRLYRLCSLFQEFTN